MKVDDLEEIGDLEGYIERTVNILVFASQVHYIALPPQPPRSSPAPKHLKNDL
jgi:hypothetical protein